MLSTPAFELLGPFNLLLEPLPQVAVEWRVELAGNLVGGIMLSAIYGKPGKNLQEAKKIGSVAASRWGGIR